MSSWTAKAHNLRAEQARILATILQELDPDDPRTLQDARTQKLDPRSGAGDHTRLRMIPVHAPGVGGTIPGTNPIAEVIRQERWRNVRRT